MVYFEVDQYGTEVCFNKEPKRYKYKEHGIWCVIKDNSYLGNHVYLPAGSIEKITGRKISWADEPIAMLSNTK